MNVTSTHIYIYICCCCFGGRGLAWASYVGVCMSELSVHVCGMYMCMCVCVLCARIVNIHLYLGGVGFDINCGVRLIRTNLSEKDVLPVREQLAQVSILWSLCYYYDDDDYDDYFTVSVWSYPSGCWFQGGHTYDSKASGLHNAHILVDHRIVRFFPRDLTFFSFFFC